MKLFLLFFLATILIQDLDAQTRLDSSSYGAWPTIMDYDISDNGNLVYYSERSMDATRQHLRLIDLKNNKESSFESTEKQYFTSDSKQLVFSKKDSIYLYNISKNQITQSIGKINMKVPKRNPDLLAYIESRSPYEMRLYNLLNKKHLSFGNISEYYFDDDGKWLVLITNFSKTDELKSIFLVHCLSGKSYLISNQYNITNLTFNNQSNKLFFVAMGKDKSLALVTCCFSITEKRTISCKVNETKMPASITNLREPNFTKDGDKITYRTEVSEPKEGAINKNVNIWSYKDDILYSETTLGNKQREIKVSKYFVQNISSGEVVQISDGTTRISRFSNSSIYVYGTKSTGLRSYIDISERSDLMLVSLLTGEEEKILKQRKYIIGEKGISPSNNYVIWFDQDSLSYFCYNIKHKTYQNLTGQLPDLFYDDETVNTGRRLPFGVSSGIIDWCNDHTLLIYSKYDIWKIDLETPSNNLNLTNGKGAELRTVFSLMNNEDAKKIDFFSKKETLKLVSFNEQTKDNGFWEAHLRNVSESPQILSSGPYVTYIPRTYRAEQIDISYPTGSIPIKAKNAKKYLIKRMDAQNAPNLYFTNDLKHFNAISNICPQRKYNWLYTELVEWTTLDGKKSQGILYKPADFDSEKSYPLILNYYGKRSDNLNVFLYPDWAKTDLDIPTYVSNGYLVFVPDIYYQQRNNGEGVISSVIPAIYKLLKSGIVKENKIGLKGHSFGGWETYYLITHSKLFAAACASSGVSDLISAYGQLNYHSGLPRHLFYETGAQGSPMGVGATLWTTPDAYIKNSPILNVNNITSPLLIMHNKEDESVPYAQGIEMFTAARRAGKKVWMLTYENEGHAVFGYDNMRDYTYRLQSFFDHFLKDTPADGWLK